MYFKKVFVIIIALLFVSCDSVVDSGNDTSQRVNKQERQEKLDDLADQQQVNQLSANISADNYSQTVSELSAIYAKRIRILGQNALSADDMTNKAFSVWPEQAQTKPDELQKEISAQLHKFQAKAKMLKAKGGKPVTAFDVMLDSKQADTTFSVVGKQYLKDVQKVFNKPHEKATYYSSKLRNLERTYQDQHELNEKEYLLISGISQSVSTYLDVVSQSDSTFSFATPAKGKVTGGIGSPIPSIAGFSCSDCPFTASNCSFRVDWGRVGALAALSASGSALIYSGRLAYWGYATTVFGPGALIGAAGDFVATTISAAVVGSNTALLTQWYVHKDCLEMMDY